jgi:hypothetical protein
VHILKDILEAVKIKSQKSKEKRALKPILGTEELIECGLRLYCWTKWTMNPSAQVAVREAEDVGDNSNWTIHAYGAFSGGPCAANHERA